MSKPRLPLRRCKPSMPCPICGGTTDKCAVLGQPPEKVICMSVQQGSFAPCTDGMGWLHPIPGAEKEQTQRRASAVKTTADVQKLKPSELDEMIKGFQRGLTTAQLDQEAARLGISAATLRNLGIGYDARARAFTFPMYAMVADKRTPVGVRYRSSDGRNKRCVTGSVNGLFIPADFNPTSNERLLLTPEGPTDTGALLDLGFRAIGRPACNQGARFIEPMLASQPRKSVVIVADRDETKFNADGSRFWPGWEGALALARDILRSCERLQLIMPPPPHKDVRAWIASGKTAGDVVDLIVAGEHIIDEGTLRERLQKLSRCKARKAG